MDVRLTAEQRQLREAAAKLADDLGPGSVADLDDANRIARLEKAVDGDGVSHAALRRRLRRRGGHRRRGVRAGAWSTCRSSGRCSPTTWRAGSAASRLCAGAEPESVDLTRSACRSGRVAARAR